MEEEDGDKQEEKEEAEIESKRCAHDYDRG